MDYPWIKKNESYRKLHNINQNPQIEAVLDGTWIHFNPSG